MSTDRYQVYRGKNSKPSTTETIETDKYKRRLSAIFSTDVKGYSRLMGSDPVHTVDTITKYRAIIAGIIDHNGGRVIDSPGDNLLAEFVSVNEAVSAAYQVQNTLKEENEKLHKHRKMIFRIGINVGEIIEEGGRIYGDGVNIAARLESLADGGGICISGTAFSQLNDSLPLQFYYMGKKSVKNISQAVKVYKADMNPKSNGYQHKLNFIHYIIGIVTLLGILYSTQLKYVLADKELFSFYILNPLDFIIDKPFLMIPILLIGAATLVGIVFKFDRHLQMISFFKRIYVMGILIISGILLMTFAADYYEPLDKSLYQSENTYFESDEDSTKIYISKNLSSEVIETAGPGNVYLTNILSGNIAGNWNGLLLRNNKTGFVMPNKQKPPILGSSLFVYELRLFTFIGINLGFVFFGIAIKLKLI